MKFPEGTIMLTGNTVIIEFANREEAEKAFDILEGIMNEPVKAKEQDIRHDNGRKRQAL
jgi:hypothetical protein